MIAPCRLSPFIEPSAVEAWDAWFRWRDQDGLHDLSIEDTWWRVADALASVEVIGEAAAWRSRFLDAMATWRLLPDERLLASAGTGRQEWREGSLHAVLNLAAFVPADNPRTWIDTAAIADYAELAVRVLDNAALLASMAPPSLRIGMTGVADALALLGLAYDSEQGRAQAAEWAAALAEGCLRGNVKLSAARGAPTGHPQDALARAWVRDMPIELLRDAERHGLRHPQLTTISSQRRLALLANDVADALDPLTEWRGPGSSTSGAAATRPVGYARHILRARGSDPGVAESAGMSLNAQLTMRAAVQPWMDEPIAYPVLLEHEPDAREQREAGLIAVRHRLGELSWRKPAAPVPA
ncbi:MAG TPA: ribonucleotide reductase N-terminal alpha domain-containing protein [Rhodanobacteraceae bacterium]|jgi:ribonucleoside-diphosphate reductase alpha chain|nr:ribonucleotide reductase N-terminal alpha domain-containing protein [Rhodanobacteraceae bacterium]